MSFATNQHFFLENDVVLVKGAKYSLLIDVKTGISRRINDFVGRIIELGENGLMISDAVNCLSSEIDASAALSFLEDLLKERFVKLSANPKPNSAKQNDPHPQEMDFLWIEVTSRCNLRCIHCYAESDESQDKEISTEIIRQVIDDAAKLGWRRIQFTGGECTLRADLLDLIRHAKTRGFEFIEVFTNGTTLTEDMIAFFAQNSINVGMSLHSYQGVTHDAITKVPGSFDRTLKSLKLLLAYGVSTRCATVAMKQNESDLDGTSYFLYKMGVLRQFPDPIRPTGRGKSMENWPTKYGLNSIQTQPNFVINEQVYEKGRQFNSCWYGKAGITSSGDVLPCLFARDQIAGNIEKQSLAEIILGNTMQKFWSLNNDRVEVCMDCEYRYICRDCRPWAYGFSGNIYAKPPRCTYDPYTGKWGNAEEAKICDTIEPLLQQAGCREC